MAVFRRASLQWLGICWLILFLCQTNAQAKPLAPEEISHVLEKIWLWECYKIAVMSYPRDREGYSLQPVIHPAIPKRGGGQTGSNGVGTADDKSFTFTEFMRRTVGQPMDENNLKDLGRTGPSSSDPQKLRELAIDIATSARGYAGTTADTVLDTDLMSFSIKSRGPPEFTKKGKYYNEKDKNRGGFDVLIAKVDGMLAELREKPENQANIEPRMATLKSLVKLILEYRHVEHRNFVFELLGKDKEHHGLGLKNIDQASVANTWAANMADADQKKKLKADGFKSADDLDKWINSHGDPDFILGKKKRFDWTAANKSHWRMMQGWKKVELHANMSPAEHGQCLRNNKGRFW